LRSLASTDEAPLAGGLGDSEVVVGAVTVVVRVSVVVEAA
jgi:hypothetical protein